MNVSTHPTPVLLPRAVRELLSERQRVVKHLQSAYWELHQADEILHHAGGIGLARGERPALNLVRLQQNLDRRFWQRCFEQLDERGLFDTVTLAHTLHHVQQRPLEFVECHVLGALARMIGRSELEVGVDLLHALQRLVRRDPQGRYRLQRTARLRYIMTDPMGLVRPGVIRAFLNTMDHAFRLLDNVPAQRGRLPDALQAHLNASGGTPYEDGYFRIRCYGNGSVHIRMLRPDLIEHANRLFDAIEEADTDPATALAGTP